MIDATIELARLFIERYQDKAEQATAAARIRESIHRELRLNAELAAEAERIRGDEPNLAERLILRMSTQSFDALAAAGLPLASIFPDAWRIADDPPPAYRRQFETINQVSELVERAYHRICIQQIRSEVGQIKDPRAYRYLAVLLGKAAQATKSSA
ncbi:hypothetical protein [Spiribacter pallidus]|uniref:hypothetical protein n=1 Tax=Spiribacter pallidus TaxID=1987936 RepID=UPI0034A03E05